MRYCVIFRKSLPDNEGEAVAIIRFNVNEIAKIDIDTKPYWIRNKYILRIVINGNCSSGIDLDRYNDVLKLPLSEDNEIVSLTAKIITETEFKTWEGFKILPRIKISLLIEDPLDTETRQWRKKFPMENNRTGNRRKFRAPIGF